MPASMAFVTDSNRPPTDWATSSNRLPNRLRGPFPSNASLGTGPPPEALHQSGRTSGMTRAHGAPKFSDEGPPCQGHSRCRCRNFGNVPFACERGSRRFAELPFPSFVMRIVFFDLCGGSVPSNGLLWRNATVSCLALGDYPPLSVPQQVLFPRPLEPFPALPFPNTPPFPSRDASEDREVLPPGRPAYAQPLSP